MARNYLAFGRPIGRFQHSRFLLAELGLLLLPAPLQQSRHRRVLRAAVDDGDVTEFLEVGHDAADVEQEDRFRRQFGIGQPPDMRISHRQERDNRVQNPEALIHDPFP